MCVTMQADSAAGFGVCDVLKSGFTESLKEEFMGILCETLGKAQNLDLEARKAMQHAANLCAERCEQKLLRQISGTTIGTAFVETSQMPFLSVDKTAVDLNHSFCAFFDLTNGDSVDDAEVMVGNLESESAADLTNSSRDSIEFMYDQGLDTMNCRTENEEFHALRQDIRGLQDLRDYTVKDLHALFQDIRGLQQKLQDVRSDLKEMDEESSSVRSTGIKRLKKPAAVEATTLQDVPEEPSTNADDQCSESVPMRRRNLMARKLESNQWKAAKSPGVCGDIGDRVRNKLLEQQKSIKAASQQRRHTKGHEDKDLSDKVQVYLSNVAKMSGESVLEV